LAYPFHHLRGCALNDYPAAPDRRQNLLRRTTATQDGCVLAVIRPQGSAMLGMACLANTLARMEGAGKGVRRGEALAYLWIK
jgi:molybdopterin biosynthesis enzyme